MVNLAPTAGRTAACLNIRRNWAFHDLFESSEKRAERGKKIIPSPIRAGSRLAALWRCSLLPLPSGTGLGPIKYSSRNPLGEEAVARCCQAGNPMTKLDAQTQELPSGPRISGYEVVQDLGRTAGSSLYRVRRARDHGLVLLKRLDVKSDPAQADRVRTEHVLLASLHGPGVPRPPALIPDGPDPRT